MIAKLNPELIQQIKASTGRVVDVAAHLGVGITTVSRYRPVRRKHLSDAEQDQVITEWLSKIKTKDTAKRLGVTKQTIHAVRRRAMSALLKGNSNGTS